VLEGGILGDIKYIRALWHRNNSWPYNASAFDKEKYDEKYGIPYYVDSWWKEVLREDVEALVDGKVDGKDGHPKLTDSSVNFGDAAKYGFQDMAELIRWRCSNKTGGGLMAELGSHQLDAASIVLGHVRPLSVQGVGGKYFYGPGRNDRQSDDCVFVTYEFPGPKHPKANKGGKDENDIVVVTYSSMNTNEFEDYGEWIMGSHGTMFLAKEADAYLWREKDKSKKGDKGGRDTKITVSGAGGGKPAMEATSTWGGGGASAAVGKAGGSSGWDTAVRGYRTEMEHFAYCVRKWQELKQPVSYEKKDGHLVHADIMPRCHGEVAMADAIIALTSNLAMDNRQRIIFEDAWFDPTSGETPEAKHGKQQKA
jgi:predicted dehydrogenase